MALFAHTVRKAAVAGALLAAAGPVLGLTASLMLTTSAVAQKAASQRQINRIVFEGNKRLKTDQLASEIGSQVRGPLSQAQVQEDVRRLYEAYRRVGRHDVTISPKMIDAPAGRVDLVFEVTEGSKTSIRTINFVGNQAYSAWRLKDQMMTSERGLLSFIKNNDIYDADKLNADQEALRRFYMRNGYADFRVISAVPELSREQNSIFITITVDEGRQYRFGRLDVASNVPGVDAAQLRSAIKGREGQVYNAEYVDRTMEDMNAAATRLGNPFVQVRTRGERDPNTGLVNLTYVVEEGPRVYVERINVRGNTRTRDYVVRREFDLAEGDAYNRVHVERALRRLRNTGFFKDVRITSEPGSAPDRVVLNVEVQDQPTGDFSIGGGYSTTDGFIGEVSVTERNFLGRGQYVKLGGSWGQRSRGIEFSFTEPFFMDYRIAAGIDAYYKETTNSAYQSYDSKMIGGALRFGIPITDDWSVQLRYSAYQQTIKLKETYRDCAAGFTPLTAACLANGEASIALREIHNKARFISMPGYSIIYNTLDRVQNPTSGIYFEFKQDFAGLGGDAKFLRTEGDLRGYYDVGADFIASLHLQAGTMTKIGGKQFAVVDQFFKGPELVRGFATAGIGPRDFTMVSPMNAWGDGLGGTNYWGASVELTAPLSFLPKDFGMRAAVFADAGSVWGYNGPKSYSGIDVQLAQQVGGRDSVGHYLRSSVGVGLLWNSPMGPLRFDYAWPITKAPWDRVQQFRFSGGTRF